MAKEARLRNVERRRVTATRHLETVNKPIVPPETLRFARDEIANLNSRKILAHARHADASREVGDLVEMMPRGLWAWITGRKSRHKIAIAQAVAVQSERRQEFDAAEVAHAGPAHRLEKRESGWRKKLVAIEAERAERRRTIMADLTRIDVEQGRLVQELAAMRVGRRRPAYFDPSASRNDPTPP